MKWCCVSIIFSALIFSCYCGSTGRFFDFFGSFYPSRLPQYEFEPQPNVEPADNRVDLAGSGDESDISFNTDDRVVVASTAFEVFAPPLHQIRATCQLTTPYNDTDHVLYIEKERTTDHSSGKAYYGSGDINETSLFNYMRIQLKSDKGEFKCHVKAIEASCDCGWGRQVVYYSLLR